MSVCSWFVSHQQLTLSGDASLSVFVFTIKLLIKVNSDSLSTYFDLVNPLKSVLNSAVTRSFLKGESAP